MGPMITSRALPTPADMGVDRKALATLARMRSGHVQKSCGLGSKNMELQRKLYNERGRATAMDPFPANLGRWLSVPWLIWGRGVIWSPDLPACLYGAVGQGAFRLS